VYTFSRLKKLLKPGLHGPICRVRFAVVYKGVVLYFLKPLARHGPPTLREDRGIYHLTFVKVTGFSRPSAAEKMLHARPAYNKPVNS